MLLPIQAADVKFLEIIGKYLSNGFLDSTMPTVTYLGNKGALWVVVAMILIITKKYRKQGVVLVIALVIGLVLGEGILKNVFKRPRPFETIEGIKLIINPPSTYSFPSGHTTSSFGAFWTIHKQFKSRAISVVAALAAILIAFSRLYLYVHYPSDVIAGVFLGILSSEIAMCSQRAWERSKCKSFD